MIQEPLKPVYIFDDCTFSPRQPEYSFSSKSILTPETQPNDALRHRLVEFLLFNSAFGRWQSLKSVYYIMTIINFLRSLKKVLSKQFQFSNKVF